MAVAPASAGATDPRAGISTRSDGSRGSGCVTGAGWTDHHIRWNRAARLSRPIRSGGAVRGCSASREKSRWPGAGIVKHVGCHTFCHSFATYLLGAGQDIRTIQELPGHKDVHSTVIYTRVLNKLGQGVRSPLDGWWACFYILPNPETETARNGVFCCRGARRPIPAATHSVVCRPDNACWADWSSS